MTKQVAPIPNDTSDALPGRSQGPIQAFLVRHEFDELTAFDLAMFRAHHDPKCGLRALERNYVNGGKEAFIVWEAESEPVLMQTLSQFLAEQSRFKFIGAVGLNVRPPQIRGVFPFSSCQPGGAVIILGEHFGVETGEFALVGPLPGGRVRLSITQWEDKLIGGIIPDITGVPDVRVGLQVVTKITSLASNVWPADFRARRETHVLPLSVFERNISTDDDEVVVFGGDRQDVETVAVYHGLPMPFSGAGRGTDVFTAHLANGWLYSGYQWTDTGRIGGGIDGSPFGPFPEPMDSPDVTLRITWFHDVLSSSSYGINVLATGPAGVPFV